MVVMRDIGGCINSRPGLVGVGGCVRGGRATRGRGVAAASAHQYAETIINYLISPDNFILYLEITNITFLLLPDIAR